jgi:alginate O-acetyltransferase complex protein AlgI
MVFSSPLFLFVFLPVVIGLYFMAPRPAKNGVLLAASLLFYFVGAGAYTLVLGYSIVLNYVLARRIERTTGRARTQALVAAILLNLGPLLAFKYFGFAADVLNELVLLSGRPWAVPRPHLFLLAGISFFTFQGISYVVDVFRGDVPACPSLADYALYKSFFPQLIAGPIVRYHDLARDLPRRTHSLADVEAGLVRFGFGLGKKVLLADNLGRVADAIFGTAAAALDPPTMWVGALCYALQIFFDFSGYSDMAIGLARVFGLSFPENFRQPYLATSITDFWRRWHMTLSTWFRDYLYIPLGGNRRGGARTAVNLVVVFFLCGLWHGAAYTFIVWGLYHGTLLIAERMLKATWQIELRGLSGRAVTSLMVTLGWVVFRAHTLSDASLFLRTMAGLSAGDHPLRSASYYLTGNNICYLCVALVCAFWPERPLFPVAWERSLRPVAALAVTALALIFQAPQSFNPFIYFQF